MLFPALFCSVLLLVVVAGYVFRAQKAQIAHLLRERGELTSSNGQLRSEYENLAQGYRQMQDELARLPVKPAYKSDRERRAERLRSQLEDVRREGVRFRKCNVMNRGEYAVFSAAMTVTRCKLPGWPYPFYVFPQVSLGEVLRTEPRTTWQGKRAHRAVNSKRCDLLVADRFGVPVAVLEYQGSGHDADGTAGVRDEIKRVAMSSAGIRFVEIERDAKPAEVEKLIQGVLDVYLREAATRKRAQG